MSQGIEIDRTTLDEWIDNFSDNPDLPFSTNFGAFSMEQVLEFTRGAANTYGSEELTAFRIYPVRYPVAASEPVDPNIELEPGSTFSRPAFVFVPIKYFKAEGNATGMGEILQNKDNKVYVLAFGYSSASARETTRTAAASLPSDPPKLCPPKC